MIDVPDCDHSELTHFLDGAQRHWRAGYAGMFPFRFAHTSAALLRRTDKTVESPSPETYRAQLELFAPADWEGTERLQREGYVVTPIEASDEESPFAVQLRMIEAVENRRKHHEIELATGFGGETLLIDGGIGEVVNSIQGARVIGLIKSHQKQYFKSLERRQLILGMRAGQRTSVFARTASKKQGDRAYSFYLKMRDGANEPPTFGLARIEMPAQPEYLADVDRIAGWILHERAPLSLPDPRFHVLPYPIHLVEAHLKARQPSDAAVRGMIGL